MGQEEQPRVIPHGLGGAWVGLEGLISPGHCGRVCDVDKGSLHRRWPHREGQRGWEHYLEKQTWAQGGMDEVSSHL